MQKNLLKQRSSAEVESDHQKPKRRFIFSEEQKDQLMRAFKYDPYPAVNQMEALASNIIVDGGSCCCNNSSLKIVVVIVLV